MSAAAVQEDAYADEATALHRVPVLRDDAARTLCWDRSSGSAAYVGPNAPTSHNDPSEEGVTLDIAGVVNFNHADTGENIWVRVG